MRPATYKIGGTPEVQPLSAAAKAGQRDRQQQEFVVTFTGGEYTTTSRTEAIRLAHQLNGSWRRA